jgi:GT2 family glycosyltransferase
MSQLSRTVRTVGLKGALNRAQLSQQASRFDTLDTGAVGAVGDEQAPGSVPRSPEPDVSIVIPLGRQWTYTAACLRSLIAVRCDASFEVIVVDDQPKDEIRTKLESVEGLIYLANEPQRGFIGSCNRGAATAKGSFIVLLKSDTQVMDGWLDALMDTFERHPDTGLAGPRVVSPPGTLRHAGGILFDDGSGCDYGTGDDPDRPEYQFVREIDFCSSACSMLPSELFAELNGLDSQFAPCGYESIDLALRVRALGRQVRIQPASNIVHHDNDTPLTDTANEGQGNRAPNREKFLEQWKIELASYPHPLPDLDDRSAVRRARDHHLQGRVLIIDAFTPEPDQDSGSLRLQYLMGCFRQLGYGVTFLPDSRSYTGRYTRRLQQSGMEVVYDPWIGSLQKFFRERGNEFDLVMISRHYIASRYLSLIRRYCPDARFVFDTVDLHFLREQRLAELEDSRPLRRAALQTRRAELAVIDAADATLVVSPAEKAVLAEAAPKARVHVISNIHEVVGSRLGFRYRQGIVFVGSYRHPPNIDAAIWFTQNVWPLVRAELPDAEFHLIGSKAPEQIKALEGNGVRFHGFVENLEPWLDNCRLAIAPLRYGAGIKGKVNISMSRGQPVVATPVAVEGMFAEPGRDLLVAETAEDFAASIIRLYRDEELWTQLSVSGLENVRKYFSTDTARLGLSELIEDLS